MSAPKEIVLPRAPWEGGRNNMVVAALVGVVGLALWFVSMSFATPQRAVFSWLWAFFFWLTPVFGCLGWLGSFHGAKARWVILPRRTLELIGAAAPIFVLLFIPILIWMKQLYPWANIELVPEKGREEAQRLFDHRHVFMNYGMWVVRAFIYLGCFVFIGERMLRLSTGQDKMENQLNTASMWRLGPGSLPFLGLCATFAAFDWLMSLDVTFYSSMFGLQVIAGAAMAGMAVWILVSIAVDTPMSHHHLHSMGKLLFAFVCFWGYTAFCQFMLIWIADVPDETPFFHMRLYSDWVYVGWFLVFFHFALPFVILLSKELKFSKKKLGGMAIYLLIVHAVDVYWLILPEINPSGPHFNLSDLFAFVGVGGVVIGFLIWRMRGRMLVPVGDPFITSSMEYHP
ncbi:MAG TPA: hypothetical protein VN947_08270 [Polyangia bacterium]|nr:hypothetical protein [Polyangia bacterium]